MTRILIVEDTAGKLAEVELLLSPHVASGKLEVTIVDCVIDAVRALNEAKFDLLILDLFLPLRSDGDPMIDGGAALLREVIERKLTRPSYVVCLTAHYVELVESNEVFNEFSTFSVIEFSPAGHWKDVLSNLVEHVIDVLGGGVQVIEYDFDYAIVTALQDPELRQVLNVFPELKPFSVVGDATTYFRGILIDQLGVERKIVAASAPQMGMSCSAVLTSKIIANFRPRLLVMCGIAAGSRKDTLICDVIASSYVFSYESGKRRKTDVGVVFEPSPNPVSADGFAVEVLTKMAADGEVLESALKTWPGERPPNLPVLRVGALASGAAVIQDSAVFERIRGEAERKLLGIDMEAYGIAVATRFHSHPSPCWLVLKGVSDFADEEKNDHFQPLAAFLSASVVRAIAMKGEIISFTNNAMD